MSAPARYLSSVAEYSRPTCKENESLLFIRLRNRDDYSFYVSFSYTPVSISYQKQLLQEVKGNLNSNYLLLKFYISHIKCNNHDSIQFLDLQATSGVCTSMTNGDPNILTIMTGEEFGDPRRTVLVTNRKFHNVA